MEQEIQRARQAYEEAIEKNRTSHLSQKNADEENKQIQSDLENPSNINDQQN